MSIEKEAAYVDGFAQALQERGISPDEFVKSAQNSGNPELEKVATAMVNLAQMRQQNGQTKQANILSKARGMVDDAAGAVGDAAGTVGSKARGAVDAVDEAAQGAGQSIYRGADRARRAAGLGPSNPRKLNLQGQTGQNIARGLGYGTGLAGAGAAAGGGYAAHQAMQPDPTLLQQAQNYVGM